MEVENENNCFISLWHKKLLTFDDKSKESKIDSLRFCLLQLSYLKSSKSAFNEDWSLKWEELEAKKHYSALMDTKMGLNNYGETIVSLSKGFKNDSKNWKCKLNASSLLKLVNNRSESYDDHNDEYEKLGTFLQSSKPKKFEKKLQTKEPLMAKSDMLKREDRTPDFSFGCDDLFGVEEHSPKTLGPISDVSKNEIFPKNGGISSLFTGTYCTQPNSERSLEAENPTPFREDKMASRSFYHQGRNIYQREPETSIRGRTKKYPWNTLKKDEEPPPKLSTFRTASHQLALENQKKYGTGACNTSSKDLYGNPKRSLGARGIKSRFIPPIRKEDDEDYGGSVSHREQKELEDSPYAHLLKDERLKNIEPKMIELIMNEIMDTGSPVTWSDIAGLELAKSTIKEIVVWPMLRPDIFTGLRGPPKGILLFGPPGTGKTMIGKCIASQSQSTFFSISASSLTSKWVGEGEKMVRAMFAVAKCHQPAVIFIDEIDSLLTQRSDTEHESSRRIKTEFLVQLDGATSGDDERLLVIGATNRPQELDEAARRRLVKRLYIPLPEFEARVKIVRNLLDKQSHSLSSEDMDDIGRKTEGYSGADMANLCREAALGPIRSLDFADIQHISVEQVRPICGDDFIAALKAIRASVSTKDLDLYDDWNKRYGISVRS